DLVEAHALLLQGAEQQEVGDAAAGGRGDLGALQVGQGFGAAALGDDERGALPVVGPGGVDPDVGAAGDGADGGRVGGAADVDGVGLERLVQVDRGGVLRPL